MVSKIRASGPSTLPTWTIYIYKHVTQSYKNFYDSFTQFDVFFFVKDNYEPPETHRGKTLMVHSLFVWKNALLPFYRNACTCPAEKFSVCFLREQTKHGRRWWRKCLIRVLFILLWWYHNMMISSMLRRHVTMSREFLNIYTIQGTFIERLPLVHGRSHFFHCFERVV